MTYTPFLSICIPSYNRPVELRNLLNSIDCKSSEIEVVICEDKAPKRAAVRSVVSEFKSASTLSIIYVENEKNYGFDGNIRQLVRCASGTYVMFMGDDDLFVPGALSKFISFLKHNQDKPYILRSYLIEHEDGLVEYFRYLPDSQSLSAGQETVAWLFKRSVSLCGFTISREEALQNETCELDGTLLYQVYLMAQVCLQHESMYCNLAVTQAVQTFRNDKPMFGNSEAEKGRFTPGRVSENNSINFTKAYFEVTKYLDEKNETNLTNLVRFDLSKYSYPFLSIQRKRGIIPFFRYAKRLENEVGFGCTGYFFIYKWALIFLGENICDKLIFLVKRKLGYTPNF